MQALGDLLQAICIFLEAPKDIIEVGLTTIIERTGGGGGAGEGIPYRLVLKFERRVLGDHFVICSRKTRVLGPRRRQYR